MGRGYNYRHHKARQLWKARVEQGQTTCARCGLPILPGQAWDLDHTDDRQGYLGPSHASCNRADGAAKTNRKRQAQRPASRVW